jgi:hypothetical protein
MCASGRTSSTTSSGPTSNRPASDWSWFAARLPRVSIAPARPAGGPGGVDERREVVGVAVAAGRGAAELEPVLEDVDPVDGDAGGQQVREVGQFVAQVGDLRGPLGPDDRGHRGAVAQGVAELVGREAGQQGDERRAGPQDRARGHDEGGGGAEDQRHPVPAGDAEVLQQAVAASTRWSSSP